MTEGQHPEYTPPPPTAPPRPHPPGYPPPPAGYPPYPPPAGGYQPQPGYGYAPASAVRPGSAVAAAVLGFVVSGFLLLAGAILIEGASLIGTISDHGSSGSEYVFDGLVNVLAAGLLIAGGVSLIGRNQSGRAMLLVGITIVLAEGIYWFGRFANGGLFFWVCLFVVPAIIAGFLAAGSATSTWLNDTTRR